MFQNVRRTNWPTFVLIALLTLLSLSIVWYLLPNSYGQLNQEVWSMSRGLFRFDTLYNAATAFIVVVLVRLASGLRPRDLGLASNPRKAVIFTALLWALTQAALLVWQLIVLGTPQWNSAWQEMGPTFVLGEFISQIFGNSLYEEIVFRGFIFVQLYLFLNHRKNLASAADSSRNFTVILRITSHPHATCERRA